MLCCGVDVQKNRLEYRVWGFGRGDRGGEAWLVEGDVIPAGPDDPAAWEAVGALLERTWTAASGEAMRLDRLAVDSGAFAEEVYGWGRHHRFDERVMLVKGDARQALVVGPRQVQEWSPTGKKARFGAAVTIVGTNRAKDYLLRKLRLEAPLPGEAAPAGYVHLPGWAPDEELRQLVAERKVRRVNRRGYVERVWTKRPGDRNEALDALVYAYAAACSAGLWSAPASFWARREEAYGPRPKGAGTAGRARPAGRAPRRAVRAARDAVRRPVPGVGRRRAPGGARKP
jgi:phage terminase large subunit GpA-like protein